MDPLVKNPAIETTTYITASMLVEQPTRRPTVFQVLQRAHELRGTKPEQEYVRVANATSCPVIDAFSSSSRSVLSYSNPRNLLPLPSPHPQLPRPTCWTSPTPHSAEIGTHTKRCRLKWLLALLRNDVVVQQRTSLLQPKICSYPVIPGHRGRYQQGANRICSRLWTSLIRSPRRGFKSLVIATMLGHLRGSRLEHRQRVDSVMPS